MDGEEVREDPNLPLRLLRAFRCGFKEMDVEVVFANINPKDKHEHPPGERKCVTAPDLTAEFCVQAVCPEYCCASEGGFEPAKIC